MAKQLIDGATRGILIDVRGDKVLCQVSGEGLHTMGGVTQSRSADRSDSVLMTQTTIKMSGPEIAIREYAVRNVQEGQRKALGRHIGELALALR